MNKQVIFVFEGIRYLVRDIHFGYKQHTDKTGRPSSTVRHSNITLLLIAQGKSIDREMIEHFAARRPFSAHIEFLVVDNGIENKISGDLEFANAKFKNWGESNKYEGFEDEDLMRVVIHPLIVRYQGVVSELPRNPSNPFQERTAPVTVREVEEEEAVIRQYVTDREGNELESYKQGDKIYCVLETQGLLNKWIDISMADKTVDFLYQGKRLKKDTIRDYQITSAIEKIPLEVIAEDHKDEI